MAASKTEEELVEGDSGYISDDSSFYGDPPLRTALEDLALSSSRSPHWANPTYPLPTPSSTIPTSPTPSQPLYNPYASLPSARQLSEPIPSFLTRLPPLTTPSTSLGPWLYVANPYSTHRALAEDRAALTTIGTELLRTYTSRRRGLEQSLQGRPQSTITRQVTALRRTLERDLLAAAKTAACTTGKWMLFPLPAHVDRVWALVAAATAEGGLGIAAKVATDGGEGERVSRLVCVYTGDFSDAADVRRVVGRLVAMGLVGTGVGERGIYYKCDAYTHLGVAAGNEWGLKASLYASKDLLKDSEQ